VSGGFRIRLLLKRKCSGIGGRARRLPGAGGAHLRRRGDVGLQEALVQIPKLACEAWAGSNDVADVKHRGDVAPALLRFDLFESP
jgi:hypothetical protein